MSDSAYRKTALPVRLNLSDRNTREQLRTGADEKASNRGNLEGVKAVSGTPVSSAAQSQKGCTDVMRKDLCDWLSTNGVAGPPPSAEAEQRAMWKWIRDFHKEYSDDWFSRNMPRLHEQFKPVFVQEMKKRKAQLAAASPAEAQAPDLLDLGGPAPAAPAPAAAAGGDDLLSLDAPAAPTPAAAAPAAAAPAPAFDGLLDLGLGGPAGVAAVTAPPAAPLPGGGLLDLGGLEAALPQAAPQAATQPQAPPAAAGGGGLLDLDLGGLNAAFGAPAPAAPLQAAPAAQAAPAPGQGGGMLDLF